MFEKIASLKMEFLGVFYSWVFAPLFRAIYKEVHKISYS